MHSRLTLKEATAEDLSVVQALARETWHAAYADMLPPGQVEYMLDSLYSSGFLTAQMRDDSMHHFLLCIDGDAHGFAALRRDERQNEIMLDKIYLRSAYHGGGYGSRFLFLLERFAAQDLEGTKMVLRVNRCNSKAIRSYLRSGFTVTGRIYTDIGSGYVMDDYWLEKSLPKSAA